MLQPEQEAFCFFLAPVVESTASVLLLLLFVKVNLDKRKKISLERDDARNILNTKDYGI